MTWGQCLLWSIGLIGLSIARAGAAESCDRSPLFVKHVDIWSPEHVQRNHDVLVVEGRIADTAPSGQIKPPAAARVIEGKGAIMLPGFIDAHVHFGYGGKGISGPDEHRWGDAAVTGPQMLRAGVTTARLHLSELKNGAMLHADSQDDCAPLPRLQAGGPAFIPGSPTHDRFPVWGVTSPEDAAARVRRVKEAGFNWIAIHESQNFSQPERDAIVGTARALGLRILGSGYTQPELAASLALSPDTIEYIDVSAQPEYDPKLLEIARTQRDLVWVARLGIHARHRAYQENPKLIDDPLNYDLMSKAEAEALRASVHEAIADRTSDHSRTMDAANPTMRRKFAQLRATGIPMAAGTDAGSPAHFHRDAIWWELRAWVQNGATVNEAVRAVTVNGASALKDESIGNLSKGSRADFLLFRGKLIETELNAKRVMTVVKGGVVHLDED
jgi:cytosine/adenosine deaminase-related metal-dependent hydrolase